MLTPEIFEQVLINGLSLSAIYVLVAVMWLIPDRRIESVFGRE